MAEDQFFQVRQISDLRRDRAVEQVRIQFQRDELGEPSDGGGDIAGEVIRLQVEKLQPRREAVDISGDRADKVVAGEVEESEGEAIV